MSRTREKTKTKRKVAGEALYFRRERTKERKTPTIAGEGVDLGQEKSKARGENEEKTKMEDEEVNKTSTQLKRFVVESPDWSISAAAEKNYSAKFQGVEASRSNYGLSLASVYSALS